MTTSHRYRFRPRLLTTLAAADKIIGRGGVKDVGYGLEPRSVIAYDLLFNVMTPILLGLMAIGALLPNLTKLKLPGFEAEVSEPKPTEPNISTGPRGDIGFGTSVPIINPDPR